ncbi:MAG: hypothetical protein ACXVAF_18575 [Vulcanimicrobiaceae bacterium]
MSPKRTHALVQLAIAIILKRCAGHSGQVGPEWRFKVGVADGTQTSLVPDIAYVSRDRLLTLPKEAREEPPFDPEFEGTRAHAWSAFVGDALAEAPSSAREAALEHEQTQIAFNSWLLFDAVITGDGYRLMDIVFEGDLRNQFTSGQMRFLERMRASHMRPYEVLQVRRDAGLLLHDLWCDEELEVRERALTQYVVQHDTLFARIIESADGAHEINGAVLTIPRQQMSGLVRRLKASYRGKLRRRPDLPPELFFKEAAVTIAQAWFERFNAPWPAMVTTEGDPIQMLDLIFDVLDRGQLLCALDAHGEMGRHEDDPACYTWFDRPQDGPLAGQNRILGTLTVGEKRLTANVLSDNRATRLREWLERAAPGAVRYRISEVHNLGGSHKRLSRAAERDRLPPESEMGGSAGVGARRSHAP